MAAFETSACSRRSRAGPGVREAAPEACGGPWVCSRPSTAGPDSLQTVAAEAWACAERIFEWEVSGVY